MVFRILFRIFASMTDKKVNINCKYCKEEYDPDIVGIVFGKESYVYNLGYCSNQCYTKSTTMRDIELEQEKEELDGKIGRLSEFLGKEFMTLPQNELRLLTKQKDLMGAYSRILGERIQNLNQ